MAVRDKFQLVLFVNMGPNGSEPHSKSRLNCSKLLLTFLIIGPHKSDILDF